LVLPKSKLKRNPVRFRSCVCSCKHLKWVSISHCFKTGRQKLKGCEPEDLPENRDMTSD